MEERDMFDSPAAKRRKLDSDDAGSRETLGSHSYLLLANVSIDVEAFNLEIRQNNSGGPPNTLVSVVSRACEGRVMSVDVTAPWLKGRATLTAVYDSIHYDILDQCSSIESICKPRKEPIVAPLVCHRADLRLDEHSARLVVQILWHDTSEARDRITPVARNILWKYFKTPQNLLPRSETWNVREFYDNVHVPDDNETNSADLKIGLLQCELYPFQRRAVRWLLHREGVNVQSSGQITAPGENDPQCLPPGFYECEDATKRKCLVNPATGVVCSSQEQVRSRYSTLKGGLLAEAMGLGKTVEMIALISLHAAQNSPLSALGSAYLRRSGATLIITPPAILEQWKQEIQGHAPSMRVYHYEGMKAISKKSRDAAIEELCNYDVVLTTYSVLAKEIHYVKEKPDRNLRNRPRLEPPKSPLDQILWWRVCLDEAQMIESGVSAAAQVARLIPRVNAWAVTGTPIKQSHKDLYGLLLFLRHEPWCNSPSAWDYLITYHRPLFRQLMNEVAIRHSKELVRNELRLPPQSRHTISMAFTNIEQAHYSQLIYDMCEDLGLNGEGSPVNDEWDPNAPKVIEKMRNWLTRLRQTCLHPEVGGRNRRALGRHHGPLRTVAQVLDVMIDQTETMLRTEQRAMLMHRVRQGQIYENAKEREHALQKYTEAYEAASTVVDECRKCLSDEIALQRNEPKTRNPKIEGRVEDEDSDIEDSDSPILAARQRLRSALEVKHVAIFFMANIYFQMKSDENQIKSDSKEFTDLEKMETEAYEAAKKIRAELLQEAVRRANKRIEDIKSKEHEDGLVPIPKMELDLEYTGIESRKIYEKLYKFCEAMNTQADQFNDLRKKMLRFLQQALIDEDEGAELQGDEYENSTKHQDEMYAYMEALRALFADRSDAVSGQENILIRVEMKNFLKAAKEGEGPAPELMIKLLAEREGKRININEQGSLRGITAELRALVSSLEWSDAAGHSSRAKAEMHVAEQILQHTNKQMASQTKSLTGLEQEVAHFRNSMNTRLEYYKSLQKISDTVAPYREEDVGKEIDEKELTKVAKEESIARNKYSTFLAKSRYLLHLKADAASEGAERLCTICQSEFETGTITSCGHVFCKDDIQLWYREHGNCPVCKRRLRAADFFDITYKPSEMVVQAEETNTTDLPPSPVNKTMVANSIYSDVGERQLNEIKNIEIRGASFGSKVDTICRHLHWLREKDPGSKTLVFSQYSEVLGVLGRAFRQNGITYSRCDDKGAIEAFKSNPGIEVFLLHAKAYSAGLNLVVASHVILCEPLINTALELQAIARIHRIGQHRPTTVWMYLIADTVEESIYDISVKRRLAHIKSKGQASRSGTQTPLLLHESAIDAANSKELQAADLSKALAPGKNSGELVEHGDLWPSLFGHPVGGGMQSGLLGAPVEAMGAASDVGRFLRFEAAESRKHS